ncbi:hypothetical protein COCSUDRAFT_33639 [Coccomyxa subellipsoidea C-169]|uniref:Uncharacterized protein n=1 Tax=Coccomyxa subellipsoidea (strain C-169) TaxID=574566 RepID=I0YSE5_COCSC|nr:hypothetical protein COCSUDRAFT_33639 [Coccomyxa subellipsoidea C-169]EIE21314.1 hypothetical protein COCSUDRAFT_33639 [Coccomyxa subellipsoidea C-169]|eukprot:XP_005645858.1 hypothetical protein COCSUDRAFT_33639 [Coccomyxa subellipsoidea C-169]
MNRLQFHMCTSDSLKYKHVLAFPKAAMIMAAKGLRPKSTSEDQITVPTDDLMTEATADASKTVLYMHSVWQSTETNIQNVKVASPAGQGPFPCRLGQLHCQH